MEAALFGTMDHAAWKLSDFYNPKSFIVAKSNSSISARSTQKVIVFSRRHSFLRDL